jgi:hypothetical protein
MSLNGQMHARSWNRCLAYHPDTGVWCGLGRSDGVFCPTHAREFRSDEAAKAATRLVGSRFVLQDPSAPRSQRWLAAWRVRRARSLRRVLLVEIDGADAFDAGIALTAMEQERPSEINR